MILGHIAALARFPVKSMAGEPLDRAFLGYAGLYGDRIFAFRKQGAPAGFPFLTARDRPEMLLLRPRFRHPDRAVAPPDLAAAEALGPGITPLYAGTDDLAVDVELPDGTRLDIASPALRDLLGAEGVTLLRSERALTDCRPLSLISRGTIAQLATETSMTLDPRRFRANLLLDLTDPAGFAENALLGRRLRIGARAEIALLSPDPRCKMITLDPDTAAPSPDLLRHVARAHAGNAGVYAAVLVEGMIHPGDPLTLVSPP
jgi:hypothetical protein